MGSMRTFGTDRRTDGQTDGGGFIRTPEGVLTSNLKVGLPREKERKTINKKMNLETKIIWRQV